MSFARLRAWDWVAFIAALALLFVTATDWYSTKQGDEARRTEQGTQPQGALGGEVPRQLKEDARIAAEGQEKNAWQASGAIDRVILLGVLATVALAVLAAFFAASGREAHRTIPPGAAAAIAAMLTALLVLYRVIQQPGFDEGTTIKLGPPLALLVLGLMGFAGANSLRAQRREPDPDPEPERAPA